MRLGRNWIRNGNETQCEVGKGNTELEWEWKWNFSGGRMCGFLSEVESMARQTSDCSGYTLVYSVVPLVVPTFLLIGTGGSAPVCIVRPLFPSQVVM